MKERLDIVWDTKFEELQAFKNAHGHMNVPQKSGPLGRWVSEQRRKCRLLVEGKVSPLRDERLAKLNGINFEFKLSRKHPTVLWDTRFQELKEFIKVNNGDANVPKKFGILGRWVSNQRKQFHRLNASKQSSLSNERLAKLNGINFQFKLQTQPPIPSWDVRFQELKEFTKVNGHTNVSKTSGSLGIWVSNQRIRFHLSKEVKASSLMDEQLAKLIGIQFEFQRKILTPWDTRFQELKEFKNAHGHTRVNKQSGQLGQWVSSQQTQFRLFHEGK
eukprot:scaffold28847_cov34-Attheya_sp.AAC.1